MLCALQEYNPDHDPTIFKSTKTGRGPLGPNWKVLPPPPPNTHTHAPLHSRTFKTLKPRDFMFFPFFMFFAVYIVFCLFDIFFRLIKLFEIFKVLRVFHISFYGV